MTTTRWAGLKDTHFRFCLGCVSSVMLQSQLRLLQNGHRCPSALGPESVHGWLALFLLGLWQDRDIIVEGQNGRKLFTQWLPGSRAGNRDGSWDKTSPKARMPTYFLYLGPTSRRLHYPQ